jgi:hypothetical protein
MKHLAIIFCFLFLVACDKGEKEFNQAPETQFSVKEINLSGENRLNSVVRLSWYGKDPDGYVKGYELSFDKTNWSYITNQDSTFQFSISAESDTVDINIYVRAVDNEGLVDPTPAFLRIPLKNTPPEGMFNDKLEFPDSVNIVATGAWTATDADGNESIKAAYLKINDGQWFEINRDRKTFSIIPQNPTVSGRGNALIYYENDKNPSSTILDGIRVNDNNTFYLKVVDVSNSESKVDTSKSFYLKGKNKDVLLISGLSSGPSDIYRNTMNNIGIPYDYIDFIANGSQNMPLLWNPTFTLMLLQYQKVVFFSDESTVVNKLNQESGMLLEFAAPSFQEYANIGGKFLITTDFKTTSNMQPIYGVMPIDTLAESSDFGVRIFNDSAIVPTDNNFPILKPTNFVDGVNTFYPTSDAEVFYTAQIKKPNTNWRGPNTVASVRKKNGKAYQVFFSVQLWKFKKNQSDLDALFNQVLNVEFN